MVDLGGLPASRVVIADYSITMRGGGQHDRYLKLKENPFAHISKNYHIPNPENGDPFIEDMPERDKWGTALCLSVLEHVRNPFAVFDGIFRIMRPGGLVILSTEFSFPYHPSPEDNFRFSSNGLKILAEHAGFNILEHGWRLDINADMGIKEIHTGVSQEIKSVYIAMSKGQLSEGIKSNFGLPKRYDKDGNEV